MFTLMIWMQLQGGVFLTVQPVAPETCSAMYRAAQQTDVLRASCMGDRHNVVKLIAQGRCLPIEVNERWINYKCMTPGDWYVVR